MSYKAQRIYSEEILTANEFTQRYPKYFGVIDLLIIGACMLGDRLLGSNLLVYFLAVYLVVRILVSTSDYAYVLLLLLIPSVGIMHISILGTSIPIVNMLICIALVRVVIEYFTITISRKYLVIIGFVLAYEWSHALYYGLKSMMLLVSWSCAVLYAALFILNAKKTYNHKITTKYFLAGVCLSIVYGVLDFYMIYGTLMTNNMTIRFKGGAGDPNYFSMYIMIAIFSMLYLVHKESNKVNKIIYPLVVVILILFGVLSLSRMFLIVMVLLMVVLVTIVLCRMKKNKKLLFFIVGASVFPFLLSIYYNEEFSAIFNLLFSRFTNYMNDPSALTSNRNVLAEQYIGLMLSNPHYTIFGMGIQDYHLRSGLIPLEAHNIILELFIVWGIVGYFVFMLFITTLMKYVDVKNKRLRKNILGWLPIICMGFSYMSINAMSTESFFILLVFAIKNINAYE